MAQLVHDRAAGLLLHPTSLPGGRLDEGESAEQAALRELDEEVGLALGPENLLGLLDDYPTRSGYVITPVVVWLDDIAEMAAQPSEVDEIHIIELAELDRPDSPRWVTIEESELRVLQLPLRNRLIRRAGRLIRPQGRLTLIVHANGKLREELELYVAG